MAGDKPARTPAKAVGVKPGLAASSSAKQRSIVSFFQKSSPAGPASSPSSKVQPPASSPSASCLKETTKANSLPKPSPFNPKSKSKQKLSTPVPSSDAIDPPSSQENQDTEVPSSAIAKSTAVTPVVNGSSPSRKVSLIDLEFCYALSNSSHRLERSLATPNPPTKTTASFPSPSHNRSAVIGGGRLLTKTSTVKETL